MIFGLIPIGGKGTRLGLPFSKEMIPQKNYDIYNPVVNHLVEKMLLAGAEKIVFVHGHEYKEDVKDYFNDERFIHILQGKLGFANVINDFFNQIDTYLGDKVLFGLPDSVFNGNPFVEMLNLPGIVCGCFTTDSYTKVDRLDKDTESYFSVKTEKRPDNLDYFWGTIKFDIENLVQMDEDKIFNAITEIGELLNIYDFKVVKGDKYIDLGTWEGYNRYLTSNEVSSNIEIEKKYDASNVRVADFDRLFLCDHFNSISSTDHYFTINNPNVEFVRYREDSQDEGAIPDLTIKNYNQSQFNRFELTVPLAKNATKHNVLHFLKLMGAEFKFEVRKDCRIAELDDYTIVYYTFTSLGKSSSVIEVELKKADLNLLKEAEHLLTHIPGFDPNNVIKKSKFQLVKEIYDKS